ncbi:MAG TPA: HlyD family efflux transporter periplasmic adaptor subunit, partial [Gemmataceae bacterium]
YDLWIKKAGSESDMRRSRAQYDKSVADKEDAKGQLLKAEQDKNKANVVLEEHEVRTTIDGVVKRLYRRKGESVKELDPIAEIQNTSHLRVEGLLEAQNRPRLARGKGTDQPLKVVIEPAPQTRWLQEFRHFQPVLSVAVSKDAKRPLIVSASEDRTARVWDRQLGQKALLPHPVAVRAVACTPPGSDANLALTGADDGVARLWDLDAAEPGKSVRELKSRHQGRIVSVAFAPDGKTCVTADEREIYLWDVASGDLKYRFPSQHRGQITSVQYTPQAKLVSAARDHSICVWRLGEKGATPDKTIDYRSGDVPVLGVSPDGQSVLFDQERALHVLSIADATWQRSEGVLEVPSEASHFAGFALFSPDGRMVLAGGTADNPLQLWKAPADGVRGHLIRRLALGPASAATCGAFAPDGSFAVTGTQDNKVVVWGLPTEADTKREITGELTFTDISIDTEGKARVWADLTNPGDVNLTPGDTVTLVILPPPEAR